MLVLKKYTYRKCQIDKKLVHLSAKFHFHRLPNVLVYQVIITPIPIYLSAVYKKKRRQQQNIHIINISTIPLRGRIKKCASDITLRKKKKKARP